MKRYKVQFCIESLMKALSKEQVIHLSNSYSPRLDPVFGVGPSTEVEALYMLLKKDRFDVDRIVVAESEAQAGVEGYKRVQEVLQTPEWKFVSATFFDSDTYHPGLTEESIVPIPKGESYGPKPIRS